MFARYFSEQFTNTVSTDALIDNGEYLFEFYCMDKKTDLVTVTWPVGGRSRI